MNAEEFDTFLEETFERIRLVLASKGNEYVANDAKSRFHNFDISAAFKSESSEQALWGFVTKQLVSLSDMVKCDSTSYPIDLWDEKLGDVINYMILLRGIVHHKHDRKVDLGFAVGEDIEEHLVVVTNDDPEIHVLPEPPRDVMAYLSGKEQMAQVRKEYEGNISTGAKSDQELTNDAVTINSEAIKAAEEMTIDIRHDGTTPKTNANLAHIGIEFNSDAIGAGTSSTAITGTPPRPGPDTLRKSKYPDLSQYTGR